MEAGGSRWSRRWRTRQDRKHYRLETSHKLCREAGRRAECWKSACSVRGGGGWKRVYGSASEALPKETGSKTDRLDLRNTAPVLDPTARNVTFAGEGCLSLSKGRYRLHDRDAKFGASFGETLAAGGVKCLRLPARSPNRNAYSERWVRTVKQECLSKLILFGEGSLRRCENWKRTTTGNATPKARATLCYSPIAEAPTTKRGRSIRCHERLGGLLKRPAVPYGSVSGAKNLAFSPRLKRVFSRKFLNRCG
jgi:hypothetical protein